MIPRSIITALHFESHQDNTDFLMCYHLSLDSTAELLEFCTQILSTINKSARCMENKQVTCNVTPLPAVHKLKKRNVKGGRLECMQYIYRTTVMVY